MPPARELLLRAQWLSRGMDWNNPWCLQIWELISPTDCFLLALPGMNLATRSARHQLHLLATPASRGIPSQLCHPACWRCRAAPVLIPPLNSFTITSSSLHLCGYKTGTHATLLYERSKAVCFIYYTVIISSVYSVVKPLCVLPFLFYPTYIGPPARLL